MVFTVVLGVFVAVAVGIGLLYVLIYIRAYNHPLNVFPGPQHLTFPVLGNLGYHDRAKGYLQEPIKLLRSKYGRVRRVFLPFGDARLDISDPTWVRYILSTNAKNFSRGGKTHWKQLGGLMLMMGQFSLVLVSGAIHKRLRKLANPAFKQTLLTEFLETFHMVTNRLINHWDRLIAEEPNHNGVVIYVREDFSKLTLDIIGLTAFGRDFNSLTRETVESTAFKCLSEMGKFDLITFLPGYSAACKLIGFLCRWKGITRTTTVLYYIRQLRIQIRQLIKDKSVGIESEVNHNHNLMQLILEAECDGKMSTQELEDTIVTFISAGHDTSSLALTWLFYLLAKHPDIQEKCRSETFDHISDDSNVSWDQLMGQHFLLCCINEALRLYPPVPYISRGSIEPDQIAGHPIPAHTDLLIVIFELHRDPQIWSDPDDFRPERFEDPSQVPWHAFMPFGDGLHKCIGYQFATAEIAMAATLLLRKYQFRLINGDEYREKSVITLSPNPHLRLRVTPIHEDFGCDDSARV